MGIPSARFDSSLQVQLLHLCLTQTQTCSEQNMETVYAILDAHDQQAQLDAEQKKEYDDQQTFVS